MIAGSHLNKRLNLRRNLPPIDSISLRIQENVQWKRLPISLSFLSSSFSLFLFFFFRPFLSFSFSFSSSCNHCLRKMAFEEECQESPFFFFLFHLHKHFVLVKTHTLAIRLPSFLPKTNEKEIRFNPQTPKLRRRFLLHRANIFSR